MRALPVCWEATMLNASPTVTDDGKDAGIESGGDGTPGTDLDAKEQWLWPEHHSVWDD